MADLNPMHDEKGWKWETLLEQPRLLTETSMLKFTSSIIWLVLTAFFPFSLSLEQYPSTVRRDSPLAKTSLSTHEG